ncbi:MAG: hypothetical protein WC554_01840 [Clostridia bacterium]
MRTQEELQIIADYVNHTDFKKEKYLGVSKICIAEQGLSFAMALSILIDIYFEYLIKNKNYNEKWFYIDNDWQSFFINRIKDFSTSNLVKFTYTDKKQLLCTINLFLLKKSNYL